MVTICKAPNGLKCIYKRNYDGMVVCALNADKEKCVHALTEEEHRERMNKSLNKAKEAI